MANICVSDVPVGANMKFVFGDRALEGRIIHNYGRGIVLQRDNGTMIEFDGCDADSVEALDVESASAWRQRISASTAEFKQLLERVKEANRDV